MAQSNPLRRGASREAIGSNIVHLEKKFLREGRSPKKAHQMAVAASLDTARRTARPGQRRPPPRPNPSVASHAQNAETAFVTTLGLTVIGAGLFGAILGAALTPECDATSKTKNAAIGFFLSAGTALTAGLTIGKAMVESEVAKR